MRCWYAKPSLYRVVIDRRRAVVQTAGRTTTAAPALPQSRIRVAEQLPETSLTITGHNALRYWKQQRESGRGTSQSSGAGASLPSHRAGASRMGYSKPPLHSRTIHVTSPQPDLSFSPFDTSVISM